MKYEYLRIDNYIPKQLLIRIWEHHCADYNRKELIRLKSVEDFQKIITDKSYFFLE